MSFVCVGLQKNIAGKNCWCTVSRYKVLLELILYCYFFVKVAYALKSMKVWEREAIFNL
jgi:hypothetical protein